ncbi:EscU/YscU/HrcU family type III secretion system export apparatus switch protein [Cellulomonas fengjieae]|uniref:EscU/YscU/HrcU family type III secretion system export apparatus switch protein n=1 Tax=Cellulomonas fengjieae TaxID=2819978 RepID=A0ABS3SHX7_9CELL|nr:EscU/YscU/HrcU family type III secretion system export apparatus switch protein [Cellulomonas fengjieae]MBO3084919.1 EscU/YscU/HrcU family type III secretion system export apparatus switch protein [Cellulomonas fengjieae]MBO3100666.1 EscU/YscU/HrcU family type III secretion system export apparatus switch protein [Cellulomonas fengjieae]QVI66478.1 EscU/YscU/HrcU family type III secretion system export apparatus switch protein [Cellulomonas fengjieae]
MSESGERSQKATAQRMKDVHGKGKLGRSQDLSAWLGLGAAAFSLPMVIERAQGAALDQLAGVRDVAQHPTTAGAVQVLDDALGSVLTTLAPLFIAVVLVTVAVAVAQGGIHRRKFKLHVEHFSPVNAAKRLAGPQAWWQGVQTLLKTAAVALVLVVGLQALVPTLVSSGQLPLSHLLSVAGDGTTSLLRAGIAAGILLAVADVFVVMRRNRKQTRMTLQEVKEENKRTEGDPMLKGAIRSKQLAMSRNRMMSEVATADVVLVNPTHVAVALRYEPGSGAPKVVAKGAGAVAARIRAEATERRVPMVEDVPLARALHAACELGQEVPAHLFTAVARVLAFVMALRRRGAGTGQHRVPGGSTLPADDTTDHRSAARAARRPARAPRPPATATGLSDPSASSSEKQGSR